MVYISGWSLARCRRSSFALLVSEQHVLFISHYCWSVGGDKNWQIRELYQIPTIAITACVKYIINLYCLVKSCQILNKPLELLSHFRDLASICDLELLVLKRKVLSSPTGDCCLCKINITVIENLPRHTVIITWACCWIFQHHVQSAAACWQVPNCLFNLSSGRTQIVCIHKEFVMIINDTLSVCNHL